MVWASNTSKQTQKVKITFMMFSYYKILWPNYSNNPTVS